MVLVTVAESQCRQIPTTRLTAVQNASFAIENKRLDHKKSDPAVEGLAVKVLLTKKSFAEQVESQVLITLIGLRLS